MVSFTFVILQCAILAFVNLTGVDLASGSLIPLLLPLNLIPYIIDISRTPRLRQYSFVLLIGYVLRFLLLYWDLLGRSIYVLPCSGNDTEMFYNSSVAFVTGSNLRSNSFITLVGSLFKVIGCSRFFSQYLLMLLSIIAVHYATRTLELIDVSKRAKQLCIVLLSLLPYFLIESAVFLRESLVIMLLSVSFYYFTKWFHGAREWNFCASLAYAVVAAVIHSGAVAIIAGYIFVHLIYNNRQKLFQLSNVNIALSLFFVVVMVIVFANYKDTLFTKMSGVSSVGDIADGVVRGNTSYAGYVGDSSSLKKMIIYTVPRFFYFMFSPVPWQWRGISDIVAFCFSSCFYICLSYKTIRYFVKRYSENRNFVICTVIILLFTLFVFAWGTSNSGTAIRHREKLVVVFAVLWCSTTPCRNDTDSVPVETDVSTEHAARSD